MTPPASPLTHRVFAEVVLLGITFIWGTTFVIVKDTLQTLPPHVLIGWRFLLGAGIVGASGIFGREGGFTRFPWRSIAVPSGILGIFLFAGFETQTLGLRHTSATSSAFITGTVTLWVPLLTWLFLGKRHGLGLWLSVPIGCAGLFLLTVAGDGAFRGAIAWGIGESLTLVCAFAFAGHIILTQRWAPQIPTKPLAMLQLFTVAGLSFLGAVITGEAVFSSAGMRAWLSVGYLALFPTALVFWAQARFQPMTTEERAAIIFLFEPVFAALVAWIVLHERLNGTQWIGAGMITLAAAIPALQPLTRNTRAPQASK